MENICISHISQAVLCKMVEAKKKSARNLEKNLSEAGKRLEMEFHLSAGQ